VNRFPMRRVGVPLCIWLVAALIAFAVTAQPKTVSAYTYTSFQVYLRDHYYHYGYHQSSFQYGNWSGSLTALQSVSLSTRVISSANTYAGWSLGGSPSWVGADDDNI
jgi:hypothetical protein